jgi:sulfite reductase beta subunit-like hemoprotein
MDILPPEYKEKIKEKYEKHVKWLKGQDSLTRATKGYESAVEWMMAKDNQKHLDLFFSNTRKYDKIRNEDTLEVFPEWKDFFDKYEKN